MWVASDLLLSVFWGIINIFLTLNLVNLPGIPPMTHRTPDLVVLEATQNNLGICLFMFVTRSETSWFLLVWGLNLPKFSMTYAEQTEASSIDVNIVTLTAILRWFICVGPDALCCYGNSFSFELCWEIWVSEVFYRFEKVSTCKVLQKLVIRVAYVYEC